MAALRIQVDPTLPPEQFNSDLLAASRWARIDRLARRLRAQRQEAEFSKALDDFKSLHFDEQASRELAEIHVRGVAA